MDNKVFWKRELFALLPDKLVRLLEHIEDDYPLEELRIRAAQPLQLYGGGRDRLLYATGGRPAATFMDCEEIFERMCGHSIYAWEDEIRNGFITLPGGYRAGICGHAVRGAQGHIQSLRDISAINIRIARAVEGAADDLLPLLLHTDGTPYSTLLLSAPGMGKTTLLRDVVRQLSYGYGGARAAKVCVVDERMELAGSVRGLAQYDIGPRTDVLSGCAKPEGIRMAVRTLSPEVIATDELGTLEDAQAVQDAAFCGVRTVATAHVEHVDALRKRMPLAGLLASGAIERVVEIGRIGERPGRVRGVYDAAMQPVSLKGEGLLCFERLRS